MMCTRKSKELNLILSSLLSAICTSQAYQLFNFVVNTNLFSILSVLIFKIREKESILKHHA